MAHFKSWPELVIDAAGGRGNFGREDGDLTSRWVIALVGPVEAPRWHSAVRCFVHFILGQDARVVPHDGSRAIAS